MSSNTNKRSLQAGRCCYFEDWLKVGYLYLGLTLRIYPGLAILVRRDVPEESPCASGKFQPRNGVPATNVS